MHAERIYDFDEGPLIDGDPDLSLSNSPSENFGVCGHLTSSGLSFVVLLNTAEAVLPETRGIGLHSLMIVRETKVFKCRRCLFVIFGSGSEKLEEPGISIELMLGWAFVVFIVNARKLEHGFRRISARIPYTLP